MLPGFPAFVGAPPLKIEFVASAVSSGETVTMPTVQAGDKAILLDWAWNNVGSPTAVTPSGWTNEISNNDLAGRLRVSTLVCAGSESGSTITGMDGDLLIDKRLVVFRKNRGVWQPLADKEVEGTNSAPATQTVTVAGKPLVIVGCYCSTLSVGTRGFSTTADAEIGSGRCYLKYKIHNDTPANADISQSDNGGNGMASFYLPLAA